MYERNIRKPPIERLPKIAALFGISIEQLLGVKEIKTNINEVSVHGNKRVVKLQEIFEQLGPADQRSVLKHASSLLANK